MQCLGVGKNHGVSIIRGTQWVLPEHRLDLANLLAHINIGQMH